MSCSLTLGQSYDTAAAADMPTMLLSTVLMAHAADMKITMLLLLLMFTQLDC